MHLELVFRTGIGLEVRDTSPDFEGHGLDPSLKDGDVIAYAGRRWLVHREPDNHDSYVCTPADEMGRFTSHLRRRLRQAQRDVLSLRGAKAACGLV